MERTDRAPTLSPNRKDKGPVQVTALFMLDTDSVSFALRGYGQVRATIAEHRPSDLCISAITLAELQYGAARRKSAKLQQLIDAFSGDVAVMEFDAACAIQFGHLANKLAERGTPIGQFDTLIASHAMTLDATLVTNNIKHFGPIQGLKVENWS
jgi:tRNA(fMet)-specific endonuclease VapC